MVSVVAKLKILTRKTMDLENVNETMDLESDKLFADSDTAEKDTLTEQVEVSKIVEDDISADAEPSDANADKKIEAEAAVKEVTDSGDDSSLHVSNLTR